MKSAKEHLEVRGSANIMIKKYFQKHSLDQEFVKKALAWSWSKNTITIPIFDKKGKGLFNRYRHLEGSAKFTSDKGSHPALYCLHRHKNTKALIMIKSLVC